jgi:hypothetical protein
MMQANTMIYTIMENVPDAPTDGHHGTFTTYERALLALERCKADTIADDPELYKDDIWIIQMTDDKVPHLRAVYLMSPEELAHCDGVAKQGTDRWFEEAVRHCSVSFTIVASPPDVFGNYY